MPYRHFVGSSSPEYVDLDVSRSLKVKGMWTFIMFIWGILGDTWCKELGNTKSSPWTRSTIMFLEQKRRFDLYFCFADVVTVPLLHFRRWEYLRARSSHKSVSSFNLTVQWDEKSNETMWKFVYVQLCEFESQIPYLILL